MNPLLKQEGWREAPGWSGRPKPLARLTTPPSRTPPASGGDHNSYMKPTLVTIVGAGPGDPDLISVKGRRCVRQADVILHDRLVHPRLLAEARADAKLIDVGKRRGREDERQLEIHRLMIAHAQQGRTVCRLKGGDPFVFGRGGEEMAALIDAGIPFEVIPGSAARPRLLPPPGFP